MTIKSSQLMSPDGYRMRTWQLNLTYLPIFYTVKVDGKHVVRTQHHGPGLLTGEWYWDSKQKYHRKVQYELLDAVKLYKAGDVEGMDSLMWVPMNKINIERLLSYDGFPPLPPGELDILRKELMEYEARMHVGAYALLTKLQTQDVPGAVHREPGILTAELQTVEPEPKTPEQIWMEAFGCTLPPAVTQKMGTRFDREMLYSELQRLSPYKLYSQQIVTAAMALRAKRMAALLDMRTGKTFALATAANLLLEAGEVKVIFVVCPVTNMGIPWTPTIQAYGWHAHMLDGSYEEDEAKLKDGAECYCLNYERLESRLDAIKQMVADRELTPDQIVVILDETSACKNPEAQRTMAAHKLSWMASWVWLANGTPLEQGPQDIWSQWACIDPFGLTFGSTFASFQAKWLYKTETGLAVRPEMNDEFESILSLYATRYLRIEADQYSGQDKTFRYIAIPPTKQQVADTKAAIEGFVEEQKRLGNVRHEIPDHPLSMQIHLREICSGYNKIPIGQNDKGQNVYRQLPYKMDAKVMWLRAWAEANPTQPMVIYSEFHYQQVAIREMLTDIGHSYVSLVPDFRRVKQWRITNLVSRDFALRLARAIFYVEAIPGLDLFSGETLLLPDWICVDEKVIRWAWTQHDHDRWLESYDDLIFTDSSGSERKEIIDSFQRGDVKHIILAPLQGAGIALHRGPAVARNIGVRPVVIYMQPIWSLGKYQQSQDRTVDSDADGKSTNTFIYHLYIKGSLEERVLKALRTKKKVQEVLLRDIDRQGFTSFTEDILTDMAEAADSKDMFDLEEMQSRITIGLSPIKKKVTWNDIDKALRKKFGLPDKKKLPDLSKWLSDEAPLSVPTAVTYLKDIHLC